MFCFDCSDGLALPPTVVEEWLLSLMQMLFLHCLVQSCGGRPTVVAYTQVSQTVCPVPLSTHQLLDQLRFRWQIPKSNCFTGKSSHICVNVILSPLGMAKVLLPPPCLCCVLLLNFISCFHCSCTEMSLRFHLFGRKNKKIIVFLQFWANFHGKRTIISRFNR